MALCFWDDYNGLQLTEAPLRVEGGWLGNLEEIESNRMAISCQHGAATRCCSVFK